MEELRLYAATESSLKARLDSSADLKLAFGRITAVCGGDTEQARALLLRVRTHAADEAQLRERVHVLIRKLFYREGGFPVDAAAVRGYLGDLLHDEIHLPIGRELILATLQKSGIRVREWALDDSVLQRISVICESYCAPLKADMINHLLLPIAPPEAILNGDGLPAGQKILVVGAAGAGKSTVLADTVERLRLSKIPALVIRMDQVPDGILTTTELGRKLLLPESPALVLAGIANGGPCVLVIDQLDAVSMASGRRTELWSLFDDLRREADRFPSTSLIVGCRQFDLEHDHRMRAMQRTQSAFAVVTLNPLSPTQIDSILQERTINPAAIQSAVKPLLTTPLHLSMFLRLDPDARVSVRNRDELFDSFWTEAERKTDHRLGRKAAWTRVIDTLANWLSARQQLSAPKDVLDDFSTDAAAMASEHVLVLADGRYRFFHESFFDYAFARRFAASGRKLSDLLLSGEQHLFRRAQVRQVLAYLRAQDLSKYLDELAFLITDNRVRFHIKRVVLQWLSSLIDPWREEWELLENAFSINPELRLQVMNAVAGMPSWFDVLDNAGFYETALAHADEVRADEAIRMLGLHPITGTRSARVAAILQKNRKPGQKWSDYLRFICRYGDVYHSREMFNLFLSLIDDGTLDGLRPGFAVNDSWWTGIYSMADKRPDLASEAIGHWLDRVLSLWRTTVTEEAEAADNPGSARDLLDALDRSGNGAHVIHMAAKSPQQYAEQLMPRIAKFAAETAKEIPNHLDMDPVWSFRAFGDNELQVHAALLSALALSLEVLAKDKPGQLDPILAPFELRPHDVIAYLVLRAWTAAPDRYADRIAEYLTTDIRRLKVGYATWSGDGSAEIYVSSQAVKAASSCCSSEHFQRLEHTILSFTDPWEAKRPRGRGLKQLELLQALDNSRLSSAGLTRLRELQRKFPDLQVASPQPITVSEIGAPISSDAQNKMSDDQWLRAMRKYTGIDDTRKSNGELGGGEYQLAQSLQERAKADPARFALLANSMGDEFPSNYFDAILRGVANCLPDKSPPDAPTITVDQAAALVRRAHALPGRPCGRWISDLVQRWKDRDWPEDVIEAVAWYAANDPDPDQELWKVAAYKGQRYYGGQPYTAGINSTRGEAAGAIQQMLFDSPGRFTLLEKPVDSLVHDKSVAVRSCAIGVLLAILNVDAQKAIRWFKECVDTDPAILNTPYVERFIKYAGYQDYVSIQPILELMLNSEESSVAEAGARQIACLA